MPPKDKLAVLVPVYNGGAALHESIRSCARAGLDSSAYEIIVVDNASSDGAVDNLPASNSDGAVIQIHRNERNLGRVGNWNRTVEIATAHNFRFVTFLFAGDQWLPDSSLPQLLTLMRQHNALFGLSPFRIAGEDGRMLRTSQRIYIGDASGAIVPTRTFLSALLSSGLFPLGPLQANIYRLSPSGTLRFDEDLPTVADVRATLRFINCREEVVALGSQPFLAWRESKTRFHASMGTAQVVRDYFDTFHIASSEIGIGVNHKRAKMRVIMNAARLILRDSSVREWRQLLAELSRCCAQSPYRSNLYYFLEALWLRFGLGRHFLKVS